MDSKTGALEMVLDQPRDVGVIFQDKDRLIQLLTLVSSGLYRSRLAYTKWKNCERTMNTEAFVHLIETVDGG
jgi:hypothetical protein